MGNTECTSSKNGTCFALHYRCMKHKIPHGGVGYLSYCKKCAPQPLGPVDFLLEICKFGCDEPIKDTTNGTTREERVEKRKRGRETLEKEEEAAAYYAEKAAYYAALISRNLNEQCEAAKQRGVN